MGVVVVTGASSGIGAATARRYGACGEVVVLVARRAERLADVASDVAAAGGTAVVEALDASDGAAVVAMAQRVVAEHGAPDVVVNCAGAGTWKYVEETSPEELRIMLAAPFLAAFHVCHAFLPSMLARKRGVLVHLNSPASMMPWPSSAGYAAARWALRGLHEALCQDLHGTGLRSTHVVLGEVSSEYFEANPESREHIPSISKWIPVLTPEASAEIVERSARRQARQVIRPFMLRAFVWSHALWPGAVRWLARATGRRRDR